MAVQCQKHGFYSNGEPCPECKTERRGRPSKTHKDGEIRPCVACRNLTVVEPTVEAPSPLIATANALVDEFIRQNVRK